MKKIAISDKNGSFSSRWIEYCVNNGIDYKLVDVYANDVIEQIKGCDAFMWHWHQADYRDRLIAIPVIRALETIGIKCFPDLNTCLHFDDKVAQKYLLEAIGAPLVKTYVFFTRQSALDWVSSTTWPMVFKLKGGAGSSNVCLIKNRHEATKFVKRAFTSGFPQYRHIDAIKEALRKRREGVGTLRELLRCIYYMLTGKTTDFSRFYGNEAGYLYAQDFIPRNEYDVRVCVVNGKAFAIKRMCRKGDFRASGSGHIVYDVAQIDKRCIALSFDVAKCLKTQSIALDYVFDEKGKPLIVEISYGFVQSVYVNCEGYWTGDMVWHPGSNFDFCGWMVESCIKEAELMNCNKRI